MQASALLLALAASASASAVNIARSNAPYFNVENLDITSFAGTKSATYSMNVTFAGVTTTCATTVYTDHLSQYCSSTAPYAPAITGFGHSICRNAAFFWSLTPSESPSGYSLSVNYTSAAGQILTGCHAIPNSAFRCVSQGDTHAQDSELYAGPHSFTMDSSSKNVCVYS